MFFWGVATRMPPAITILAWTFISTWGGLISDICFALTSSMLARMRYDFNFLHSNPITYLVDSPNRVVVFAVLKRKNVGICTRCLSYGSRPSHCLPSKDKQRRSPRWYVEGIANEARRHKCLRRDLRSRDAIPINYTSRRHLPLLRFLTWFQNFAKFGT